MNNILNKIYQALYIDGDKVVLKLNDITRHGISYDFDSDSMEFRFSRYRDENDFRRLKETGNYDDDQLDVMHEFYSGTDIVCKERHAIDVPDRWEKISNPSWIWEHMDGAVEQHA